MTQKDRDRLVVVKKAQKKLITQRQAAEELEISERQVRRLLVGLRETGYQSIVHALRGRSSNRKLSQEIREKAVRILSQEIYRGFGPTLAAEYLAKKHDIQLGREALRQLMVGAGLWRARRQKIEAIHEWRQRRSCRGEMVQWDTSEHDWLEGRGEKMYLIHMIDDATSELTARFVRHDSTEENMRLLWSYVEQHGRPMAFYTDKAAMFQTPSRTPRGATALPRDEREPLPPTQLGRGLRELGIAWIAAHSAPAKGRVERSFGTAQDRLVKGLRVAGAKTLEQANVYLQQEYLPWWNQHLVVVPANPTDAHRPLGSQHDLHASLSLVDTRQVANDYTIRFQRQIYQIAREHIGTGLRGANVRVEARLDGSLAVRFQDRYLSISPCQPQPRVAPPPPLPRKAKTSAPPKAWRKGHEQLMQTKGMPVWRAANIDRTRTRQSLD